MVFHGRESGTSQGGGPSLCGGEGCVLGALLTDLDFPSENEFASGVVDWAKSRDVTVVLFSGGPLHSQTARNAAFRLASNTWLDGLIMSPFLRHLVSEEEITRFCEQYAPLPIVMGATGFEGVPHVRVDSFGGMRDVVSHLIESHHLRRIAFITGPEGDPEAEERYRAYKTALRDHDLKVDPDLVVSGNFMEASGASAVRGLLNAQVSFDAVVGANDAMAAGAYSVLHDRGLNVPEDVALAGFDDAPDLRASLSLTTARQSFYELAHHVGDTLLDRVQGRSVPTQTLVPAPLVVRRSCGCVSDRVVRAAVGRSAREGEPRRDDPLGEQYKPQDLPVEIWQAFAENMREAEGTQILTGDTSSSGIARPLTFLRALERHMQSFSGRWNSIDVWHQRLNEMRQAIVPFLETADAVLKAEDLLQQGRIIVAENVERMANAALKDFQTQAALLRTLDVELGGAQDFAELVPAIQGTLPQLGVHQCYLVRWVGRVHERAQWVLIVNDRRAGVVDQMFSVERGLIPDGVINAGSKEALVVLPLTVEGDVLGYAVVGWGPQDGGVYHRIEARFSSVFHRFGLLEEADRARRQAEQTLEEVVNMRSIVDHLQRAVDTEAVLRITLAELSKVLNAPRAVARLGTREQLLEAAVDDRAADSHLADGRPTHSRRGGSDR